VNYCFMILLTLSFTTFILVLVQESQLLPPPRGIVICRVCWLVRSYVGLHPTAVASGGIQWRRSWRGVIALPQ